MPGATVRNRNSLARRSTLATLFECRTHPRTRVDIQLEPRGPISVVRLVESGFDALEVQAAAHQTVVETTTLGDGTPLTHVREDSTTDGALGFAGLTLALSAGCAHREPPPIELDTDWIRPRLDEGAHELETVVADDLWPLPTYQEMLFIK